MWRIRQLLKSKTRSKAIQFNRPHIYEKKNVFTSSTQSSESHFTIIAKHLRHFFSFIFIESSLCKALLQNFDYEIVSKQFKWHNRCIFDYYFDIYRLYNTKFFFYFFFFSQQILFHLSQFTPRRQTIRLKEQKSHKKLKNEKATQNELASMSCVDLNKLCTDSLTEVMRNFQTSPNASILELSLNTIVAQKWPLKHWQRPSSRIDSLETKIKTSYISNASFQQNKAEPMWCPLNTTTLNVAQTNNFLQITHLIGQLSQPQFVR